MGYRMGSGILEDGMTYDALIDAFYNYHAGVTAENLVDMYSISRQEADEWALDEPSAGLRGHRCRKVQGRDCAR